MAQQKEYVPHHPFNLDDGEIRVEGDASVLVLPAAIAVGAMLDYEDLLEKVERLGKRVEELERGVDRALLVGQHEVVKRDGIIMNLEELLAVLRAYVGGEVFDDFARKLFHPDVARVMTSDQDTEGEDYPETPREKRERRRYRRRRKVLASEE